MTAMKLAAVFACVAVSAAPLPAAAAAPDTAEIRLQHSYVLTLDLVRRYAASVRAEKAAVARDPTLRAEIAAMQGPPDEEVSHAQSIARLKAHPRLAGFFAANGLNETDAVMVGVVIISAAFASGEHDLSAFPEVTPAQVAFMREHDAELRALLKGVFTDEP